MNIFSLRTSIFDNVKGDIHAKKKRKEQDFQKILSSQCWYCSALS